MERRRPVGDTGTGLGSQGTLRFVGVDADDVDAAGAKESNGQLTNESEAHDHDRLAALSVDQTKPLQRDRGERREGRLFVGNARGDARGKDGVGRDHFGMRRIGDHAVADREAGDLARVEHFAHVAVAEGDRLGELAADCFNGGDQAFGTDLREHRAEFLGLLARLAQPTAAAELDQHALRAQRDQRARRADEQAAATRTRGGYGEEFGATRAQMLDDLTQLRKDGFARPRIAP